MAEPNVVIDRTVKGKSCLFRLFYEGKPVSRLWVHDLTVRFGESLVRMGGIGGVETEEAYRMRGFARKLMEAANEYMKEQGFDIACLFGIPNFYERWGYITALPEYRLKVPTSNLKGIELKHRVDNYSPDTHRADVLSIYEQNNRNRVCSVVRDLESWSTFVRGTDWFVKADVKVFLNENGEVVGYLSLDDVTERTAVAEVGYKTAQVFESMVAFLAQRAERHGHNEVIFLIPPDHEFAFYLRRLGCSLVQEFPRSGGGMVRVINLGSLLEKLSTELSQRLRKSDLHDFEGEFALVTDIGCAVLKVKRGSVEASTEGCSEPSLKLEIPQCKLAQLLTGYQTITLLASDKDVKCPPNLIPLLQVLFPPSYPYIWWADRF